MRLKSLRLHGFKSFADRTNLEFRDGVTAIVGSNGCGKSNVADSIRWVLGEQRASMVRGSKMEEVIFQGTARRRPLNFAEVTLTFDNESGRIAVPHTEIEIARKVFREGASDYSMNRVACRLRDIQSLLRDTGLGANAYAIIEGAMVEALLSDRTEQRRALFEEAAGIGKYKDSRHSATRRLDAAEVDLARLADLIAEVESKVRLLNRQRRRAERHRELQSRRLDLEMALARYELERRAVEYREKETHRALLDEAERAASAEKTTAEARAEARKLEVAEVVRRRGVQFSAIEVVRGTLNEVERESLLAEERRTNTELRLSGLRSEKIRLLERMEELRDGLQRDQQDRAGLARRTEEARERSASRVAANLESKQALIEARQTSETLGARARALALRLAAAEVERAAVERREAEALEKELDKTAELQRVLAEIGQMTDQTELWQAEADELARKFEAARRSLTEKQESVKMLRARELRARDEVRAAEERLSRLGAQVVAREELERNYEGFVPAVAAIMTSLQQFPGVRGPLADFVRRGRLAEDQLQAYESYLGPLLQALVVDDLATARAIRDWFRSQWSGGGTLVLLPLETLTNDERLAKPHAPERWAEVLLDHLEITTSDPLSDLTPGSARVRPGGESIDSRGIVRLLDDKGDQGILTRREHLTGLRRQIQQAEADLSNREAARVRLLEELESAESEHRQAAEVNVALDSRLKSLKLDSEAHHNRRVRIRAQRDSLEREIDALRGAAGEAAQRRTELETQLASLSAELESTTSLEAVTRQTLADLEVAWDTAREAEAALRIELASSEGELRELDRRIQSTGSSIERTSARIAEIDAEVAAGSDVLAQIQTLLRRTAGQLESLFARRDELNAELTVFDAQLAEFDSELAELAERARSARRRESEAVEGRHRLDLELRSLESESDRIRERIEIEWGRPWGALASEVQPVVGDPEDWKAGLRSATEEVAALGAINVLAVEEHAEEERRLNFLRGQQADLIAARDDLAAAIKQINRTARDVFLSTFESIRTNFQRTFHSLFEGGNCDLVLTDPGDPLESAVEIKASPLGKKTQSIHLLSGGERTLTALALLFALYLVKPSPFCVMDEVDAPLDESNVGRFLKLLQDFKSDTQFIVITHNLRTMEAADWVYGVTMEEAGVSSIVGVELLGAWGYDSTPVASVV